MDVETRLRGMSDDDFAVWWSAEVAAAEAEEDLCPVPPVGARRWRRLGRWRWERTRRLNLCAAEYARRQEFRRRARLEPCQLSLLAGSA